MQKRFSVATLVLCAALVIFTASILTLRVSISQLAEYGSLETRIAHFEQDMESFVRQIKKSSGAYIENAGTPLFNSQIVLATPPRVEQGPPQVLGLTTAGQSEKWIEINLSKQQLTTWQGTLKLKEYPVSTGLAGSPTVKGEFRVWRKVLSQGYRGGSQARGNYYYLPNVPYSLFFHKGYAIHAAYWHNDFGIRPRSHGCVNMRVDDAKEVYEWANPVMPPDLKAFNADEANPGTRIVIHD